MKQIVLTDGSVTLVDDADHAELAEHPWEALRNKRGHCYAIRRITVNGKRIKILMHRVILNAPKGVMCDHKNRNTLDNQRHNLRLATVSQNSSNKKLQSNNKSGFKGVGWNKELQRWRADIRVKGRLLYLGLFDSKEAAARAYDAAALKYFEEFACQNQKLGLLPVIS